MKVSWSEGRNGWSRTEQANLRKVARGSIGLLRSRSWRLIQRGMEMSESRQSRPRPKNGAPVLREETPPSLQWEPTPSAHRGSTWPGSWLPLPSARRPGFWPSACAHTTSRPGPFAPWLSPPGRGKVTLLSLQAGTEELRNFCLPSLPYTSQPPPPKKKVF